MNVFLTSRIIPTAAALCRSGGGARAANWTESGDAPDLPPAQITMGTGSLTALDTRARALRRASPRCSRTHSVRWPVTSA